MKGLKKAKRRRVRGELCIYCGWIATSEDHFPPLSSSFTGFLLPACRECNILAGTAHPTALLERLEFVKSKLYRRYADYFAIPDWTEQELAQLDLTLRDNVRASLKMKRIAAERIAWDGVSYLRQIDREHWLIIPNDPGSAAKNC